MVVIGIRAMYYAVCCTLCLAVTGFWGPLPVDEAEGMYNLCILICFLKFGFINGVAQALYPRSDSIVRFLHGRPGSIEPDRCHIRIADDWRFRKIYENVIFR